MKLPNHLIPSTPSYDLKGHLAHVRKLYEKYPYRTYDEGQAAMPGIMSQICDRFPEHIADQLGDAVYTVLREANVFFLDAPEDEDATYLKRLQFVFTSPSWPKEGIQAAGRLFRELYRRLPQSVFAEEAGTAIESDLPVGSIAECYPTRVGRWVSCGLRQSIPDSR
jgi:hypothetical protein